MRARVVIGANFGDEGKGLVTDWLCSQGAGCVVRFNGGAQAGHTVVTPDGERHVFSHFGAGTLQNVPTFLSQFFICNPILYFKELTLLNKLGYAPRIYAHPNCLVTTFGDMIINQRLEDKRGAGKHGSCGVGVGETVERSQFVSLTMSDLWNKIGSLESKVAEICNKYASYRGVEPIGGWEAMAEVFIKGCWAFAEQVRPLGIQQCPDPVFEGAQGLLLDMDHKGYFPHVTRSKTGMHNVRILCQQAGITDITPYYVSRTYLTRHGAGPLPGEGLVHYSDNTNTVNTYQGAIRYAPLDHGLRERIRLDAGDLSDRTELFFTHEDHQPLPEWADDVIVSNGPSRSDVRLTMEDEADVRKRLTAT